MGYGGIENYGGYAVSTVGFIIVHNSGGIWQANAGMWLDYAGIYDYGGGNMRGSIITVGLWWDLYLWDMMGVTFMVGFCQIMLIFGWMW